MNNTLFPENSRYCAKEITEIELTAGKTVVYLKRRFVPLPENFELLLFSDFDIQFSDIRFRCTQK